MSPPERVSPPGPPFRPSPGGSGSASCGRPIDIPTDAESQEQLSAALDEEFTRDPAFRQECQALWSQVTNGGAANSFQGQAKNVVMTRDIHGGFTIQ